MWRSKPRPLVLVAVSATIAPLPACVRAAPTTALQQPVRGRTIAIDPGHNGQNWRHLAEINRLVNAGTVRKPCDTTGTATASGYTEAAYNFDVARRLAAILRAEGARVVLTRHGTTAGGRASTSGPRSLTGHTRLLRSRSTPTEDSPWRGDSMSSTRRASGA
jgi:hypothetical protein